MLKTIEPSNNQKYAKLKSSIAASLPVKFLNHLKLLIANCLRKYYNMLKKECV